MYATSPRSDRPNETARRDDAARADFLRGLRMVREGVVLAAQAARRLQVSGHCVFEGCESIEELGQKLGASAAEIRQFAALGRVLEVNPPVEAQVLEGRISLPCGALLDEMLTHPERLRPGDDWVYLASTLSPRKLRRQIELRIRSLTPGEPPPVVMSVLANAQVCDDFARARTLASRRADRMLTDGETLAAVVDHYLDSFDPQRTKDGVRRMPHTSEAPGRTVPAAELRKVMARNGDACAIPGCDNDVFLQNAHIHPHAKGGHREADNLLRLCSKHHRQFDEGKIRMIGTADRPTFFDAKGRPLAPPPHEVKGEANGAQDPPRAGPPKVGEGCGERDRVSQAPPPDPKSSGLDPPTPRDEQPPAERSPPRKTG